MRQAGITPNQPPVANANGPYSGTAGTAITFDASISHDPDGDIVLYEWDWDNDGIYDNSTTSPTITHTWNTEFSGSITLMVTDNDGLTAIDSASVSIGPSIVVITVDIDIKPSSDPLIASTPRAKE